MLAKTFILLAGLFGSSAVILGALEAHMLKDRLATMTTELEAEERLERSQTAGRYQMIHAVALLGAGLLALQRKHFLVCAAGITIALGMLLFCGPLHINAYTGNTDVLKAAPYGGMLLIIGWLALGCGGALAKPSDSDCPRPTHVPAAGDDKK